MQINKSVLGIGFTLGLVAAMASCSIDREVTNPEFCWNAAGDATCAARYADEGLFYCSQEGTPCTADGYYGCVSERPAIDECYSPCGGQKSIVDDSSCLGVADEGSEIGDSGSSTDSMGSSDSSSDSTDEGMMTESSSSTESSDSTGCACASDLDCDGQTPACAACECVACTAENGELCKNDWMACDADQSICVACADCPNDVCNHSTGQCVDGIHVDGDGGQDFLSIQEALASFMMRDMQIGTIILHQMTSEPGYLINDSVISINGVDISIIAADGESPSIDSSSSDKPHLFEVSNGGSLYLAGLDIHGKRGILVDTGSAVHLVSTSIVTEQKSLDVNSGYATVSNCMLTSTLSETSVIEMATSTQLDITFSTVYNDGMAKAIDCPPIYFGISIAARNSIITNTQGMSATDCFLETSMGNLIQTSVDSQSWFSGETDLHLTDSGQTAAAGKAMWGIGDPTIDIDGQVRPQGVTYAGADVPQ